MERPRLKTRVRRTVHLLVLIAAATCAIAYLPGKRYYVDWSFTRLDHETNAGGLPIVLTMLALLLPAALVYRAPSRLRVWSWAGWTVVVCVIALVATLDIELKAHVEELWPARAVEVLVGTVLVLLLCVLPVLALVTRERPEPVPEARLR